MFQAFSCSSRKLPGLLSTQIFEICRSEIPLIYLDVHVHGTKRNLTDKDILSLAPYRHQDRCTAQCVFSVVQNQTQPVLPVDMPFVMIAGCCIVLPS